MNYEDSLNAELCSVVREIGEVKAQLLLLARAFEQSTLEDPRVQCYLDGTDAGIKVLRCLYAQKNLLLKLIGEA